MIFIKKEEPSKFLRFIQEADGDEPQKRNQKVINIRKPSGRRTDYTQGADLEDEPEDGGDEPVTDDTDYSDEPDSGEDAPTDDAGDDSGTDDSVGDEENIDASDNSGNEDGGDEPVTDDTDYSDEPDSGEDAPTDDAGDDSGTDEPTTDDTDYSEDDDSSSEGDDGGTGAGEDNPDNPDSGGNSSNDEQVRKYALYKKFLKLDSTLGGIIEKLSSALSDNPDINQKYKIITNKVKTLKELLSQYMIIRFSKSSYIQSMLFYQRVMAAMEITLGILKELQKELNKKSNA